MISFVLQPFNKEHIVVFTMSGVAALSKLTYVKYNLPQEVQNFCFSKKFNLAFFFITTKNFPYICTLYWDLFIHTILSRGL